MYSAERYRAVEEALQSDSCDFNDEGRNDELARTLLITAYELQRIHSEFKYEYGDEAEERHQYQDTFFVKGTHSLYALHRLVKHYRYDASYREVRYLFETYFTVRGLNRDKEQAEEIVEEYLDEKESLDDDLGRVEEALHEFDAVDELHRIRRDEMDRAADVSDVKRMYGFFSNRSSHPVRLIAAGLDGSRHEELEEQLLTWGLYLSYGLCRELLKTYNDTRGGPFIKRESQPIVRRFDEILGKDVPTFLLDEY